MVSTGGFVGQWLGALLIRREPANASIRGWIPPPASINLPDIMHGAAVHDVTQHITSARVHTRVGTF